MSERTYYNKLVRDRIEEKILNNGEECEVRVVEDQEEFEQELFKKIIEEARALAFAKSRKGFLDEYADLMVVLDALTATLEFDDADIKTAIEENLERKGGFSKRHFLHWSSNGQYKSNESTQGING